MHDDRVRRCFWVLVLTSACSRTGAPPPVAPVETAPRVVEAPAPPEPEVVAEPTTPSCATLETCLARVGDVEIPYSDFAAVYDLKVAKYTVRGRTVPASADRRYRKSIAERLIYHEVLAQECAAQGVDYDPAALAEREARMRRGIRDWQKHLDRRGETEASLRAMFVAELREQALLGKAGALDITPAEVEADYEQIKHNWKSDKPRIRASHIMVPLDPVDAPVSRPATAAERKRWDAEARAKATEIHARAVASGMDFAALAKEVSVGPGADNGGDIGIFTADRMDAAFSKAALALKVGEVSAPVRTKFGYHVIKLTGSWPPGILPVDALEDSIRNRLRQRKLHQGRRLLKERLLNSYEVLDNMKPTLGPEPMRRHDGEREGPGTPPKTAMWQR